MNRLSLAMLLCVVLFGSGALAAAVQDQRPLRPGQALHLRMDAGELRIVAGTAAEARVEATLAPGQGLRWREVTDRLVLVVDDRDRLSPRAATLAVSVPADTDLVLHLGDARLQLAGVGGRRLVVHGGDGDLRIDSPGGRVVVESRRGAIDVRVPSGQLSTRSLSGNQTLAAGGDVRLDASTGSGALQTTLAGGGAVRLSSLSGRIQLRAGPTATLDAQLDSLSGELEVLVPAGQAFDLRLAQATGEARLPAPLQQQPDGRYRLGEGGGRLQMESFSGNLVVVISPTPLAPAAPAGQAGAPVDP